MRFGWLMALVGSVLLGCDNPRAQGTTAEGSDGRSAARGPDEGYLDMRCHE